METAEQHLLTCVAAFRSAATMSKQPHMLRCMSRGIKGLCLFKPSVQCDLQRQTWCPNENAKPYACEPYLPCALQTLRVLLFCFAGARGGELETPRRENLDTPRKPSSSKIFRGLKRRISRAFDGPTGKPQGETVDGDSAGSTPVTTPNSGRIRATAPGEQGGGTRVGLHICC